MRRRYSAASVLPVERAAVIKRELRTALLRWFDGAKRDLPWRRTKDAYGIWVSEVMLQQTQVDRVVNYWTRFLARFPDVKTLAAAELKDVLGLWSGLGYYSRARNLHRAATVIAKEFKGELPDAVDALLELPGFGRYTAGAVASIAYGLEAPLVDGNVARVLSRLLLIEGRPPDRAREKTLWAVADVLVSGERPGDWNQALMELGATVCTPQNPTCLLCPVRTACGALANDRVHELPSPKLATKRKVLELRVAVARRKGEVLLARREEKGLFAGLWELPSTGGALEALLGARAEIGPELHVLERTLTHRDLVLRVHPVRVPTKLGRAPKGYVEWRWVPDSEVPSLGMSSAMSEVLRQVT